MKASVLRQLDQINFLPSLVFLIVNSEIQSFYDAGNLVNCMMSFEPFCNLTTVSRRTLYLT